MLPIDIARVTASASARVLARAIDDGTTQDQIAALLSIVKGSVEMLVASSTDQLDGVPMSADITVPRLGTVIVLSDRRAARSANPNEAGARLV